MNTNGVEVICKILIVSYYLACFLQVKLYIKVATLINNQQMVKTSRRDHKNLWKTASTRF